MGHVQYSVRGAAQRDVADLDTGTEESVEAVFFWVSVVYNFTRCHPSLMQRHLVSGERLDRTPAMALGLTDRRWTVEEVVRYRLSPPHTALCAVV